MWCCPRFRLPMSRAVVASSEEPVLGKGISCACAVDTTIKFGMLPSNQQYIPKSLLRESGGLTSNFILPQGHAQNRIISREPAVATVIDALVG